MTAQTATGVSVGLATERGRPGNDEDRIVSPTLVGRNGELDLLAVLAVAQPVVLVLEDVHWADAQTREFVGCWLAGPPTALALVLTYRSEEADPEVAALTARLPSLAGHEHVQLAALDAPDTGALAGAILGAETVSAEFASHLWEADRRAAAGSRAGASAGASAWCAGAPHWRLGPQGAG